MSNRKKCTSRTRVPRRDEHFRYQIDGWAAIGAIIADDAPDADYLRVAAVLLGIPGLTCDETLDAIRGLHKSGWLGVGDDGRAFMSRPLTGPDGDVIDRVPLTDDERRELRAEARELRAEAEVDELESWLEDQP